MPKVYENEQKRDAQSGRLNGGNSSAKAGADSGGHGSPRGLAIGSEATLRVAKQNEKVRGDGNCPAGESCELHDQPKNSGKRYVGGDRAVEIGNPNKELVGIQGCRAGGNPDEYPFESSPAKKGSKRLTGGVERL